MCEKGTSDAELKTWDAENFYYMLIARLTCYNCFTKEKYLEEKGKYCDAEKIEKIKEKLETYNHIKEKHSCTCCKEKHCDSEKLYQYLEDVVPDWICMTPNRLYNHIQNMFENSEQIRRFEISLLWRRAIYFATIIIALAYIFGWLMVNEKSYISNTMFPVIGTEGLLAALAAMNALFCLFFACINAESQKWQENWENHVDYLQDILGLHLMRVCLRNKSYFWKISNINVLAGAVAFWFWVFISIALLADLQFNITKYNQELEFWRALILLITFIALIFLSWKMLGWLRGRKIGIFNGCCNPVYKLNMYKRPLNNLDFKKATEIRNKTL